MKMKWTRLTFSIFRIYIYFTTRTFNSQTTMPTTDPYEMFLLFDIISLNLPSDYLKI